MTRATKRRRIVLFPLFRVELIQMIRHDEIEKAIDTAGREIRLALEQQSDNGSDDGEDGGQDRSDGVIMVPSPSRAYELNYTDTQPEPNSLKESKL